MAMVFWQGTIVVDGFNGFFTSEPLLSMVFNGFHISTIGINGFSNGFHRWTIAIEWMVFRVTIDIDGFSMVLEKASYGH